MRISLALSGLLLLVVLWLGPLPEQARHSFAAHMMLHIGVVAVAAPFLAIGIAGGPFDPVRSAPTMFAPLPTSLIELLVVWVWHTPELHRYARHSSGGLVAEQGLFLLSGLLVWLSAFGGEPRQRAGRVGAGVIALLLTSMHMTLLGALLALPRRPLYPHMTGIGDFTPLEDQHLGGAIMLVVGGVSYLLGGLWLTREFLRESEKAPRKQTQVPSHLTGGEQKRSPDGSRENWGQL